MLATIIPTREVCKPLRTGQITSYVDYDDGYYANLGLGMAKEYLVLDAAGSQYDGTTNITLNGKTDVHSNNCVLDIKTGEIWSRYVSASVGPGLDGKLPWTTNGNGEGIFPYCAAANLANLGGYGVWRVPSINELIYIYNHETMFPDNVAFIGYPTYSTYSSTTSKLTTTKARAMATGQEIFVYDAIKATFYGYVLLVLGGS